MKFLDLYSSLGVSERNQFVKLMKSGFLGNLYEAVLAAEWIQTRDAIAENTFNRDLFQQVYGSKPYRDAAVRKLLFRLNEALEKFIKCKMVLEGQPPLGDFLLLHYLRTKHCNRSFSSHSRQYLESLQSEAEESEWKYLLLSKAESEIALYYAQHGGAYLSEIDQSNRQSLKYADVFFLQQRAKSLLGNLNYKNVYGKEFDLLFGEELGRFLMDKRQDLDGLSALYAHAYDCLLHEEDEAKFILWKHALFESSNQIHVSELKDMFSLIQNYCIRKLNRGRSSFNTELYDIYLYGLEWGLLVENGELAFRHYNNIVRLSLALKKIDWAQNFIEEYYRNLPAEDRQSSYIYNKSLLCYFKNEFDDAVKLLNKANLNDDFYGINFRVLLAKCYYETDEWETLGYLFDSFKRFVQRKKGISQDHRSNSLRFIKLCSALTRVRPYDKPGLKRLQANIEKAVTVEKSWLVEKIGELQQKTE